MNPNQLVPDVVAEITARATTDAAFRQALLRNTEQTLEHHGYRSRDVAGVRFVERGPNAEVVVVLPDFTAADDEMSDAELESVAGGAPCSECGDVTATVILCQQTRHSGGGI